MEHITNLTIKQVTNIVNEMKQIRKHPDYAMNGFQQKVSAEVKFENTKSLESKYVNLANSYDISIEDLNTIWNKYGNVL